MARALSAEAPLSGTEAAQGGGGAAQRSAPDLLVCLLLAVISCPA